MEGHRYLGGVRARLSSPRWSRDEDENKYVREGAVAALGETKDARAVEALVEARRT